MAENLTDNLAEVWQTIGGKIVVTSVTKIGAKNLARKLPQILTQKLAQKNGEKNCVFSLEISSTPPLVGWKVVEALVQGRQSNKIK